MKPTTAALRAVARRLPSALTTVISGRTPDSIMFTLPEAPSANRYWRHVGSRTLLARDARTYRTTVGRLILAQHGTHGVRPFTKPGSRVAVTLSWYRGRKSGDLDNRIKQVLDALKGIAYADDSQITELHCFRYDDKANPRMEIIVRLAA